MKLSRFCNYYLLFGLFIILYVFFGCSGQSLTTREMLMSPEQTLINYALANNGGTAESNYNNPDYPPSAVINGDTSSLNWDNGGGWEGGLSRYRLKDLLKLSYIQVNLPGKKQVKSIVVYTLDSPKYPAKEYGLRTYRLEYWHGAGWEKIRTKDDGDKLFAVKDNKKGKIVHDIQGELVTDKIRLIPIYSNDIDRTYSLTAFAGRSFYNVEGSARVVEIEAWCVTDVPEVAVSEEELNRFPLGKDRPSPDELAIRKILADYKQGYDNENIEQVMSVFSENFTTIEGKSRKEIEDKAKKFFEEYSSINITLRDVRINIAPSGDMATAEANYTLQCVAEINGNPYRNTGSLVFDFRKESDDNWKIIRAK